MSPLVKYLLKMRPKLNKIQSQQEKVTLQEKINKLIRGNQIAAVKKESNRHKNGSKRWWSTLNKLTGRGQNTPVSNIISPDEINLYFQSINTDLDYSRPEQVEIPEGCRIPYIDERTASLLSSKQKKSASGPDDLRFWLWRDYSHHLAPIICSIFNCSLRKQCVPQLWKLANITPIPKESPFSECNQLRPISLTPIIMRIFEKAVYKKEIFGFLEQAIGPDQFAYEKNCNTPFAVHLRKIYIHLHQPLKLYGKYTFISTFMNFINANELSITLFTYVLTFNSINGITIAPLDIQR